MTEKESSIYLTVQMIFKNGFEIMKSNKVNSDETQAEFCDAQSVFQIFFIINFNKLKYLTSKTKLIGFKKIKWI